jgi:FkbM family methyltransferase|tara:strand:- start:5129 stop:5977 length:849 start_codon:yes stop_codon:yes gene_type:complete
MVPIKKILNKLFLYIIHFLDKIYFFKAYHYQVINFALNKTSKVRHGNINLLLSTPTKLSKWRAETFSSKEPETLEWIDGFDNNSIFWDIGSNIGLYSVYAAIKSQCNVCCFEPSFFNLELLSKNIFLNNVSDKITVFPFALSDKRINSLLNLTTTEWSGALSTFDEDYGFDGEKLKTVFKQSTIGMSADEAKKILGIAQPDYIKIDVDGIEHLILLGATNILQKTKEILIEVNDNFTLQSDACIKILTDSGFILFSKKHSEMIDNSVTGFNKTYNQVWKKYS